MEGDTPGGFPPVEFDDGHEPGYVPQPDGGGWPRVAEGGWCVPLSALHDLPRIAVPRGDVVYEYRSEPLPSPSRRVRFRSWRWRVRYRFRAALHAWRHWDDDEEGR